MLLLLQNYNDVSSLSEGDRNEIDLVEITIETGNAVPKKQAVCRTPFVTRHKIAVQLQRMLKHKVIQLSSSVWASPIVLVRKKVTVLHGLPEPHHSDQARQLLSLED